MTTDRLEVPFHGDGIVNKNYGYSKFTKSVNLLKITELYTLSIFGT